MVKGFRAWGLGFGAVGVCGGPVLTSAPKFRPAQNL